MWAAACCSSRSSRSRPIPRGGNRPGFSAAAPPALGRQLFDTVLAIARQQHAPVAAGVFGADMQVHLVNDGPVTIPDHDPLTAMAPRQIPTASVMLSTRWSGVQIRRSSPWAAWP